MMSDVEKQVFDALNEIFQRSGFSLVFREHFKTEMVCLVSDTRVRDDATMCCWRSIKEMFIDNSFHNTLFSELKFLKKNVEKLDELSGFKNFSRFLSACAQHSLESLAGCSCLEEVLLKLSCLHCVAGS